MSDANIVAIIVAIITGVFSVLGQWIISNQQTQKRKTEDAVRDARQEDRLASIEKKLDEHNGYAQKFAEIQTDIAVIKAKIGQL